jgi:hypothetical protein
MQGNGYWERAGRWPSGDMHHMHHVDLDLLDSRWDNPTVIVTLDSKRRLTVPSGLVPVSPGDYFDVSFDADEDALVFRRLPGKESWLTVLKDCPVSPDDVPPRRRAPSRRRKL